MTENVGFDPRNLTVRAGTQTLRARGPVLQQACPPPRRGK